ncbi:MAG: hypothetical protein KF757_04615 [Phycisphaeraceae bacterium]|nr:hypothetical protein [Phycisphaeraceae bacterium]MCW5764268.1 hypothetical protein [Phycisphaeraceae bacterium]
MNLTASKSNSPDNVHYLRSAITQFENEAAICDKAASSIEPQNALLSSARSAAQSDRGEYLFATIRELYTRDLLPGSVVTHLTCQTFQDMIDRNERQRPCRRWGGTEFNFTFNMPEDSACWALFEAGVAASRSLMLDHSDCSLGIVEYEPDVDGYWLCDGERMPDGWDPTLLLIEISETLPAETLPPEEQPKVDFRFKRSSRITTGRGFSAEKWRIREARRCQVRAAVCRWVAQELKQFQILLGDEGVTTHWHSVCQAASLLRRDIPSLSEKKARARVSINAQRRKFFTNGKHRQKLRIEPFSFDSWRLAQRDKELDKEDSNL